MTHARKGFADKFCIIHGNAPGADSLAHIWAMNLRIPIISMPANWNGLGNRAGPFRNGWMLEWAMPDLVIAFPGGPGTADMKQKARKAGVTVWEPYGEAG
jgi:predicted Rossmann-fold nucleotide-binding protein